VRVYGDSRTYIRSTNGPTTGCTTSRYPYDLPGRSYDTVHLYLVSYLILPYTIFRETYCYNNVKSLCMRNNEYRMASMEEQPGTVKAQGQLLSLRSKRNQSICVSIVLTVFLHCDSTLTMNKVYDNQL